MLRTLRLTSIVSVIIAVCGVVVVVLYGFKPNAEMKAFLSEQSIVEKLNKAGQVSGPKGDLVTPLIDQAHQFALRIDPPPPPPPPPPVTPPPVKPVVPTQVATVTDVITPTRTFNAKFDLVGTAKYKDYPKKSMALLNVVSEGVKWYRQGETVGRLTIQEVKEGSIVLFQDGKHNSELFVPAPAPIKSLLKSDQKAQATATGPSSTSTVMGSGTEPPVVGQQPIAEAASDEQGIVSREGLRSGTNLPPRVIRSPSPLPAPVVIQSPEPPQPVMTIEERNKELDNNIQSIKQIMTETGEGRTEAEKQEEMKAWQELLIILEQEKKSIKQ